VATGLSVFGGCDSDPSLTEPTVRNPLRLPPTITARDQTLAATETVLELDDGKTSRAWGYNGHLPGPTLRVRRGENVNIRLRNELHDETTIHWHGMIVPHSMDGHPLDAVSPGNTYTYHYPILQRAGMNWYHPHPHHHTGEQIFGGLAGALIVEDPEEAALGLPSGMCELPLIVRDARVDSAGNLRYRGTSSGFKGDFGLVNGVPYATTEVGNALYRLRLLNGANARVFRLALTNGAPVTLIGNDGGLLEVPATVSRIDFAPAERLDLLLDLRQRAVGERVVLRCDRAGWDLLEFVVTEEIDSHARVPEFLSTIEALSPADVSEERTFRFEGNHRINGKEFEMDRVEFRVPLGRTERWRFQSDGGAPHPVHVHGASFQVESRRGGRGRLFPWELGWKDTVLLQERETVDVLVRFEHYTGLYLLHCHKLEHEDGGMMMNFEVY